MLRVVVIADALRIVEHSEKNDDDRVTALRPRGEVEADRRHMTPVLLAVEHRAERGRRRAHEREHRFKVERGGCGRVPLERYARAATFRPPVGTFTAGAGLLPFREAFELAAPQTVSMMRRVVTYGSAFAFGRRSSM